MLQVIVFLVLAFFAYKYADGWYGVGGLALIFVVANVVAQAIRSSRNQKQTDSLLHRKLSDDERKHLGEVGDHQRAMDAHRAQFDPELRNKLGQK